MQLSELCKVHGIGRTTMYSWIAEWKRENPGALFPGEYPINSRLTLWDPRMFHDCFLVPKKFNAVTGAIVWKNGAKIYED